MRISLTALRAFEATARLSSMSAASAELRVGLASISRHVSALQARMGVALLRREGRRVVLTPAGESYFAEITAAFHNINHATSRIIGGNRPRRGLTIAADRSFAQRWLLPRLADFCAQHPNLDLSLIEPGEAEADITLSWRRPGLPLASGELILAEPPQLPIASAGAAPVANLAALLRSHTLIHARTRELWREWLAQAGHPGEPPPGGLLMPDKSMALVAASRGMGVSLACTILAEPELASGQCRVMLPIGVVLGRYVATPHARSGHEPGAAGEFITWLRHRLDETQSARLALAA